MNPKVDLYLANGCGRCPLGGTPDCKVHLWTDVLVALRQLVLDCGLAEEVKWGVPCYTFQNSNIVMIYAFKDCAAISFMKGSLLSDPEDILILPGENSQVAKWVRLTTAKQVAELEETLKTYIYEAIEVEKAGLKVVLKDVSEYVIPEEFQQKMDEMPVLKAAYEALTPGRQKSYLLHFSQAKQSQTRISRIEKCIPKILEGKGFHD